MNPAELQRARIDALLASFQAKKAEIARRSNLSWTAVAGYLIFIYSAAGAIMDNENTFAWSLAVWLVSVAAYLFMYSQFLVIMALSAYIKDRIDPQLNNETGKTIQPGGTLLGEGAETYGTALIFLDQSSFLLLLTFVVAPALLNGFAIYLSEGSEPYLPLCCLFGIGIAALMGLVFTLKMSPP